ncbi:MAG TPA: hypothetical protein PK961_01940 [bacterium]|nr:hypothetical protein [bacterium]
MKPSSTILWVLVLSLLLLFTGCGHDADIADSTADDDDDSIATQADLQPGIAPQGEGDDTVSDDTPTEESDAAASPMRPEEDYLKPDVEYGALTCVLPDPVGLGEGTLFGGGPATDQVTVYVFDGETCAPMPSARVQFGLNSYYTNNEGRVVIPIVADGPVTVSVYKQYYTSWSYTLDAAVMYFRLAPDYPNQISNDSQPGAFTLDGQPLSLTNPQNLVDAFIDPLHFGLVLPGQSLARNSLLDAHEYFTWNDFEICLAYEYGPDCTHLPTNFYIPDVNVMLDIPGYGELGVWAVNETYQIPVYENALRTSVQAFLPQVDLAAMMDFETFAAMVVELATSGDFFDVFKPLIVPLFNRGASVSHVGALPDWDLIGKPDMEVQEVGVDGQSIPFIVNGAQSEFDYLAILGAEVPNRSLIPLSLAALDKEPVFLDYAAMPDADYLVLSVKTDMLKTSGEFSNMQVALKYAEDISGFEDGVAFEDQDYGPRFDPELTHYNYSTGEVAWELLDEDRDIDLFLVIVMPNYYSYYMPAHMAVLPRDARSHTVPFTAWGLRPDDFDLVTVLAIDFPNEPEEGFDPSKIFNYNIKRMSAWFYPDPIVLFNDLL